MDTIKLGKYKHFKSDEKIYEVIGIAHHSETLEEMVVYKALYDANTYGRNSLWVRPLKMFLETVTHNGKKVQRFTYIGS